MCGRFALFLSVDDVQVAFDLGDVVVSWTPKYNVAPGQQVLAVTEEKPRSAVELKWGINIHSEREKKDIQLINVRSETILEKGHFRRPRYNLCLILANGFYEWRRNASKQPFFFHLKDNEPFAFAGLWTVEKHAEDEVGACAIVTCQVNSLVEPVHSRMPVMLERHIAKDWLKAQTPADFKKFLLPYPTEGMNSHPVGKMVNKPAYDTPDCITVI
jgi:putative SOS response-associated peptidase YedK